MANGTTGSLTGCLKRSIHQIRILFAMVLQVALELESLEDVYQVRDFLRGKGFNVYWTAATHIPGNDASELSMLYAKRESCSSLSVDTEGYILVDKPTEEESEGKRHR